MESTWKPVSPFSYKLYQVEYVSLEGIMLSVLIFNLFLDYLRISFLRLKGMMKASQKKTGKPIWPTSCSRENVSYLKVCIYYICV